jgi:hypothetical protein
MCHRLLHRRYAVKQEGRLSGIPQGGPCPLGVLMAWGRLQVPAQPVADGVVVRPITRGTQTEADPFAIIERVDGAWLSI